MPPNSLLPLPEQPRRPICTRTCQHTGDDPFPSIRRRVDVDTNCYRKWRSHFQRPSNYLQLAIQRLTLKLPIPRSPPTQAPWLPSASPPSTKTTLPPRLQPKYILTLASFSTELIPTGDCLPVYPALETGPISAAWRDWWVERCGLWIKSWSHLALLCMRSKHWVYRMEHCNDGLEKSLFGRLMICFFFTWFVTWIDKYHDVVPRKRHLMNHDIRFLNTHPFVNVVSLSRFTKCIS